MENNNQTTAFDETDTKTKDAFERCKEGLDDEANISHKGQSNQAELPSTHSEPRRKCGNGCNNCQ